VLSEGVLASRSECCLPIGVVCKAKCPPSGSLTHLCVVYKHRRTLIPKLESVVASSLRFGWSGPRRGAAPRTGGDDPYLGRRPKEMAA
jgi:hypothetical protein